MDDVGEDDSDVGEDDVGEDDDFSVDSLFDSGDYGLRFMIIVMMVIMIVVFGAVLAGILKMD